MAKAKQTTLVFKSSEVRRCIHHAISSTRWAKWSSDDSKEHALDYAALVVISDYTGTYIVSAGYPRDKLRNKKIYSAYAAGSDHNAKELILDSDSTYCRDMSEEPYLRSTRLAVIYLSIGENGHCYEEILAEAYDTFTVTITDAVDEQVEILFDKRTKHINTVINKLNMNNDEIVESNTSKRRLITDNEQSVQPQRTDTKRGITPLHENSG
jgi:hypothetical protein